MISAWLLLAMLAALVYGFVRLNAKAKWLEARVRWVDARETDLDDRERVLGVRERAADATNRALAARVHLQANTQKEIA